MTGKGFRMARIYLASKWLSMKASLWMAGFLSLTASLASTNPAVG